MNKIKKVFLDTSFFIRLLNPKEANHINALTYFRRFNRDKVEMCLSSIVVAEYGIGGNIAHFPYPFVQLIPFNFDHAKMTATFAKAAYEARRKGALEVGKRVIILNDTKLMAQAQIEEADLFVGIDDNFLSVYKFLKSQGLASFNYLDLRTPPNEFYGELDLKIPYE
ncbi:MAG: PIN domain-containing protein [Bacteroidota bacterium]